MADWTFDPQASADLGVKAGTGGVKTGGGSFFDSLGFNPLDILGGGMSVPSLTFQQSSSATATSGVNYQGGSWAVGGNASATSSDTQSPVSGSNNDPWGWTPGPGSSASQWLPLAILGGVAILGVALVMK